MEDVQAGEQGGVGEMIKYVYIAGPLSSSGNYLENVRQAVVAAEKLLEMGFVPFVPHLSALWQLISPHDEHEYWLPMDLAWIDRCDAVLRLPGESKGADAETEHALAQGKPVFGSIEEIAWR